MHIDNEYFQSGFGNAEYFQELEDTFRAGGIVVPLTYNDPGEGKNFVNGTVSSDIFHMNKSSFFTLIRVLSISTGNRIICY